MSETLLNTNQNQLNNDDGSFVELIQTVQNGKAKLAQAIIDKGSNISVNSTLDQMTQAVNNLRLADGKGNFLVQGFYDWYDSTNIYPANTICGRFIPHHNAIICAKTDGSIEIYQLADNGLSFNTLGSVSTGLTFGAQNYILFGWNRSETKFVLYDCYSSNRNLVIMSMDWTNKILTLDLTYHIQGDIAGGSGKEDQTGYNSDTYGVTINNDGSIVLIFTGNSTLYGTSVIPDYENETATESVGYGHDGYGFYMGYGGQYGFNGSIYYYDSTTGIVEGLDSTTCIFNFQVDLSGDYPKLFNYVNVHPREQGFPLNNGSYPLIIKDIDSTKDYYVQILSKGEGSYQTTGYYPKASIFIKKYTGTEDITYDRLELQKLPTGFKTTYSTSNPATNLRFYYYNINYYTKNSEIYLLIGSLFVIKIDESGPTPKLVVVNTNNLKSEENILVRPPLIGIDNGSGMCMEMIFYSPANPQKCWLYDYSMEYNKHNFGYIIGDQSSYGRMLEYKDPCVMAFKFVDTKSNSQVIATDFDISTYNSGGYRLYEEASILTEDA